MGKTRQAAQEEVAQAYGIFDTAETIDKWRGRLKSELGAVAFHVMIRTARNAGTFCRHQPSDIISIEAKAQFGDDALRKAGEDYQSRKSG
jgi:hypothetical protein